MKTNVSGRSGLVARTSGLPCRMEGLEPRLLLADELFIGLGDVQFRDGPQLPDDKIEVPVTVQNLSPMQISGKIRIQIWASGDDVLDDPGDFLCFEGNININPRPNEIQTKKVKAKLPLDIRPGEYEFIVTVIDESMLPGDASFDVETNDDNESFDVRWVFGEVEGRSGNTTLKFMNTSGVIYKINFSDNFSPGDSFGEVTTILLLDRDERGGIPPDGQFLQLDVEDVNSNARISVRRIGGPSDPDLFYLTGIDVDETMGFFDASDLTLMGPAHFDGLGKLFLGNVKNAGEVDIDNDFFVEFPRGSAELFVFSERVSIKVKEVTGTVFDIRGTLANMQATSFSGEVESDELRGKNGGLGGIEANFIDKVNIKNDFEGFVFAESFFTETAARNADEGPPPERVINAFIVGGMLSGGMQTFGNVAKIEAGSIDGFEAQIFGRLERLNVKGDIGVNPFRGGLTNIIGATDISRIDISGGLFDSQIFAGLEFNLIQRGGGYEFGDLYGGNVSNASFTSGIIGRVNIGGDMLLAEIAAGVDPDGNPFFSQGFLVGDSTMSRIGPIKVGGMLGKVNFVSGDFPDTVSLSGSSYNTMTDPDDYFDFVFPLV